MINLLEIFKNEDGFTKKIFGQHFLTNKHILDEIVSATNPSANTNIIEIGPGCGVLTQLFAETKANVKAVEIDKDLVEFLRRYLFFYQNLEIINQDATTCDFSSIFPDKEVVFVGNLPYNVSVKIFEKVTLSNCNISSMVFMFQKEVADRINAKPNNKAYSSLSVFASYFFDIEKVRDISGGNFWPNANVMSSVLKFTPKKNRLLNENEEKDFFSFIKQCFAQKRKTLKNNLKNINKIDDIIISNSLSINIRAEQLELNDFVNLYKKIKC